LADISTAPKLLTIRHSRSQTAELKVNFLIRGAETVKHNKSQQGLEPCWTALAGPAGIFYMDVEEHNKVWNLVGQLQLVPQGFSTWM
jgi:hypothetical protein